MPRPSAAAALLLLPPLAAAADNIRGVIAPKGAAWPFEPSTLEQISDRLYVNQCFRGLGLDSCYIQGDVAGWDHTQTDNYNDVGDGDPYCLACCSNSRATSAVDDRWPLVCPLDHDSVDAVNLFDYEFVLARRHTQDDTATVSCDLPRNDTDSFLAGYTLTIAVAERSGWVEVVSCSAVAEEVDAAGVVDVYETIQFESGGARALPLLGVLALLPLLLL